jgi:hypothetical protein
MSVMGLGRERELVGWRVRRFGNVEFVFRGWKRIFRRGMNCMFNYSRSGVFFTQNPSNLNTDYHPHPFEETGIAEFGIDTSPEVVARLAS